MCTKEVAAQLAANPVEWVAAVAAEPGTAVDTVKQDS